MYILAFISIMTEMDEITAQKAKQTLGQLMDRAQKAPVAITKHGRPWAVLTSEEEYQSLMRLKLEKLKKDVQAGIDQLDRGEFSSRSIEDIKSEARKRSEERDAES
ncbi:MAG: type II toxin-antitoxin system Phd/YefM family antitoxin [Verrucomicrobiia bacterium]